MAPPVILIPATSSEFTRTLQGGESRHFISEREFAAWAKHHPSIRPSTTTGSSGETTPKGYQAPQHPASHVFKTIPPRAPVRSTRSNILSYTLHLAITSRLSAFHAPNGTADLLLRAETGDALEAGQFTRLDEEDKAAGLWKLANSLFRESQRSGELPNSVKRRVALTAFAESLLANPPNDIALSTSSTVQLKESSTDAGVDRLVPLTTPNSTTLYSTIKAPSEAGNSSSIAQTLIDMKFGGKEEEMPPSPIDKASSGPVASTSRLTAEPHMDYRIKRGQAMRSRAKEIFGTSILPLTASPWCRRHRVSGCVVCKTIAALPPVNLRARTIPGQGLEGTRIRSELLVNLIPAFLELSANLLRDLRERAAAYEHESLEYTVAVVADAEIQVTAAWYSLLTSFLVQACLQGYLVDGWTGTAAIETLLGVGCGVWEGRGWSARIPPPRSNASISTQASLKRSRGDWTMEVDGNASDSDSDDDDEDEDNGEAVKERERESLLEAAQTLFGTRDVAQADYEKTQRDLMQEFLDIAEGSTLTAHLSKLNAKYRLSTFENEMVEFIESTAKLLGQPALAKYESASPSTPQLSRGDPDPYALTRYFCRPEIAEAAAAAAAVEQRDTKRRKIGS